MYPGVPHGGPPFRSIGGYRLPENLILRTVGARSLDLESQRPESVVAILIEQKRADLEAVVDEPNLGELRTLELLLIGTPSGGRGPEYGILKTNSSKLGLHPGRRLEVGSTNLGDCTTFEGE